MMKNTFKSAKVGQKVYSLTYGTGRVSRNSGDDFSVFFNNKKKDERIIVAYSYDGKQQYLNYPSKRDLYFKKPVFTTKERLTTLMVDFYGEGIELGAFLERILPTHEKAMPAVTRDVIKAFEAKLKQLGFEIKRINKG